MGQLYECHDVDLQKMGMIRLPSGRHEMIHALSNKNDARMHRANARLDLQQAIEFLNGDKLYRAMEYISYAVKNINSAEKLEKQNDSVV